MDGSIIHAPTDPVRLDLACGQSPREGFRGVDLYAPGAERVDLCRFPWPWADSSVDEAHCSHFIEHIPARAVEARDVDGDPEAWVGRDMLFAFFDELHRVLKPGAKATIIWPALKTTRAFMDPTHRRFIPAETFGYLSAAWRTANGLDHYRVSCDFASNVNPSVPADMTLRSADAQAWMFSIGWDRVYDFHATITKP